MHAGAGAGAPLSCHWAAALMSLVLPLSTAASAVCAATGSRMPIDGPETEAHRSAAPRRTVAAPTARRPSSGSTPLDADAGPGPGPGTTLQTRPVALRVRLTVVLADLLLATACPLSSSLACAQTASCCRSPALARPATTRWLFPPCLGAGLACAAISRHPKLRKLEAIYCHRPISRPPSNGPPLPATRSGIRRDAVGAPCGMRCPHGNRRRRKTIRALPVAESRRRSHGEVTLVAWPQTSARAHGTQQSRRARRPFHCRRHLALLT